MNPITLLLAWLDARPRARAVVYGVALWTSVVLAALVWGLPLFDVDHIWRISLDDLAKVAIATGGIAGLIAGRNVPPASTPDDGE